MEEMKQMSIFDFRKYADDDKPKLPTYEIFRDEYCSHMGGFLRFGDKDSPVVKACSYKNLHLAKGWEDWQPCTRENCPFFNGRWAEKTTHENEAIRL